MRSISYFLLVLFSLILMISFSARSGESGYRIQLKIDGISDSLCYLAYHYGDKQYMADTAEVSPKGEVVFRGEEPLPGGIYLVVMPNKKYFEILISEQHFSLETKADEPVAHMKFKNSHENDIFYEFIQFSNQFNEDRERHSKSLKALEDDTVATKQIREELQIIETEVLDRKKEIIQKYPDSFYANLLKCTIIPELPNPERMETDSTYKYDYYKAHFLDNIDFTDHRLIRTPVLKSQLDTYLDKYNYPMPDSLRPSIDMILEKASVNDDMFKFAAIHMVNKYANSKIMGQDELYVYLVDEVYGGGKAVWADSAQLKKMSDRSKAIKPTLIGKIAPNIIVKDEEGTTHNLHKIEAKRTILYFWDAKCGHCKKFTPKLVELFRKYEQKDVAMFSMCTSTEKDKWIEARDKVGIYWQDLTDIYNRSRFRQNYDITSTPRLFLLDEDKRIIAKRIGTEQLEKMLQQAFEEN